MRKITAMFILVLFSIFFCKEKETETTKVDCKKEPKAAECKKDKPKK